MHLQHFLLFWRFFSCVQYQFFGHCLPTQQGILDAVICPRIRVCVSRAECVWDCVSSIFFYLREFTNQFLENNILILSMISYRLSLSFSQCNTRMKLTIDELPRTKMRWLKLSLNQNNSNSYWVIISINPSWQLIYYWFIPTSEYLEWEETKTTEHINTNVATYVAVKQSDTPMLLIDVDYDKLCYMLRVMSNQKVLKTKI